MSKIKKWDIFALGVEKGRRVIKVGIRKPRYFIELTDKQLKYWKENND